MKKLQLFTIENEETVRVIDLPKSIQKKIWKENNSSFFWMDDSRIKKSEFCGDFSLLRNNDRFFITHNQDDFSIEINFF